MRWAKNQVLSSQAITNCLIYLDVVILYWAIKEINEIVMDVQPMPVNLQAKK